MRILFYLPSPDIITLAQASGNEKEFIKILVIYKCRCIDLRKTEFYFEGKIISSNYLETYFNCINPLQKSPNHILNHLTLKNKKIKIRYTLWWQEDKNCEMWGPIILLLPSNLKYNTKRLMDIRFTNLFFRHINYYIKIKSNKHQITNINSHLEIIRRTYF